ncbi:MAG: lactonase family protein, partial [Chloroflexi bacterium]|nr:lactonase family protein [Chloroflexota bacterium]
DVVYADGNSTADIHVSPDGRHVYGSNRGHDTLVIYGWDPYARMLYYIANESTRGNTPRNFAIDPTGTWVLAENQDSGTIHTFKRDADSGELAHTGHMISIPGPVCIQMMDA